MSQSGDAPAEPGAVGRLVDCSQADDRRMIRLVRARRLLYARNNMPVASYYAQVKRLWDDVADEMGWTVAEVRRKWAHIRNSYSRHLRNELGGARTGRGRAVSRWYLADELEFLREHMATDTRLTSAASLSAAPFSMFGSSLEVSLTESAPPTESVDVKPFIGTPWFALNAPAGSAPARRSSLHASEPPDEGSDGSQAFGPDEGSSYFQFFRGLHADYLELSARRRRLFQRHCLARLHQLLDEQDAAGSAGGAQWEGGGEVVVEGEVDADGEDGAVNLSHAAGGASAAGRVCVVENVESYSILPNN